MTTRMKQTRNKITWYASIVLTLFGLITFFLMYVHEESTANLITVITTVIGALMAIVGFYQASEGYTKGKYINKAENVREIDK